MPTPEPAHRASEEVRRVRERGAFSRHELFGVLEVTGPDSLSFLESQLPVGVLALLPGSGAFTAYLDAKGRITHELLLLRLEDRAWMLGRRPRLGSLLEKLERYHIREELTARDRSAELAVWEVHGPAVPEILAQNGGRAAPPELGGHVLLGSEGTEVRYVVHPWTGDPGGHLILPRDRESAALALLIDPDTGSSLPEVGESALETLRIEGGRPEFGRDMDDHTLLPELGRPEMVSYEKGCYLGQETVARIHSRGHVNRLLLGLAVEGETIPDSGTAVLEGEAQVGESQSACYSPSLGGVIALAMLRTRVADPGKVVHLRMPDGLVAARIHELPFHRARGPREMARAFYREGLEAFKEDRFEEALRLFERATLMDPSHLEALESRGISLERLGRLDEAALIMESITQVAPDHLMAWTNLSRYRAAAGQLEEAERLKGHVTYLVMKRDAGERAAAKQARETEATERARKVERLGLFEEVLALDPEDVVANFGLGKILLDLERWEEAAPRFRKAIEVQPSYSMAYSHLGTCLLRSGRSEEAAQIWRQGITEATRRGDLIPKREMEQKLAQLPAPAAEPERPPA